VNGRTRSKLDADLLTGQEIELLMRQCSRRAPTGVRSRALIAVCWRCGLRIGEALALAPKDFDPDSGTLVVQRGKGGKRRVVGVDVGTVALVTRWLESRRKHAPRGGKNP
jgi:integrase